MKKFTTPKGTELPLLDMRGKDYLQVAHRLVWFRETRPDWAIETTVTPSANACLSGAVIKDDKGRVIATAHKFEDAKGFPDYIEKSETGAIGRALALCGFGTQFCSDELDEGKRLADSPVVKISPTVHASQPEAGDGFHDDAYRIPFGKFAKRTLEEIDLNELRGYVDYIEKKAVKDNKPITGNVLDFVQRAYDHIGAFENGATG